MQRPKIGLATASFLLLFLQYSATAQTQGADSLISEISSGPAVTYSIQQCIDSAIHNNPNVKSFEFTERTAKANYFGQIGTMLPTLYGTANYLNNGGKSINNFTNQYVTENYNQGQGQLYGGIPLWNGFSIHNFIRQYALAYEADKKDWQYQKDLITITIIQDFLSIMGTEELLDLAQKQAVDIRHSAQLMTIQDTLGAIPHSTLTDELAFLNAAELNIISTKNNLEQGKLKLAQDMNIPYSPNMDVVKLNVDQNPVLYNASVDQVYQNATHNIAAIQAQELHVASARKGVQANRGNMAPTLSFQYYLTTNYSTAATTNPLLNTTYNPDGSYIILNGSQVPVIAPQGNYGNVKIPFNTQFKNNFFTQVGLNLSIPILNRLNYRTAYNNSKILLDQAIFQQKTINTNLRQAVESNYVTMVQAFRTYNVTYREVQNYEESFREAQIKYDNGALASLAFVIYNTNKNNSELNLISAKYSYLLTTKILDYYQGQLTW